MDAAALVEVDWEPLPAVADPFAAMADGAPQLFDDAPKNIEHTNTIKAGDPDAAFAKAHRVVKQRMTSPRPSGIPMETRAVLAAPALVQAQAPSSYPDRPIRLVVAFPPGGATDTLARQITQALGEALRYGWIDGVGASLDDAS